MSAYRFHEGRRSDASVEWYELAIVGDKPRLTPKARAARWIVAGSLVFWAGVGAAVWCML